MFNIMLVILILYVFSAFVFFLFLTLEIHNQTKRENKMVEYLKIRTENAPCKTCGTLVSLKKITCTKCTINTQEQNEFNLFPKR